MSLFGNIDQGDNKPKFATSNTSTIDGSTIYGVSVTEKANTQGKGPFVTHSGWVVAKMGTGPLVSITITNPGAGINANGFLIITGAGGSGANAAYFVSSNANSTLNVVTSVVVLSGGVGYNSAVTLSFTGSNTTLPAFTSVMGGRADRLSHEVIVANGSISGDDSIDNGLFPGS